MTIKNMLKEEFQNKERIIELRYTSSKLIFVIITLLFFTNLYLYSAGLYPDFFSLSISILYLLLIVSLAFFTYFFIMIKLGSKLGGNKKFALMGIILVFCIAFLVPMFLKHI